MAKRYPEPRAFEAVIDRIVFERPGARDDLPSVVSITPSTKVNELYVGIHQLDFSKNAKSGYFPHMASLTMAMKNIIYTNFDPFREPLQVQVAENPTRAVENFSVGYLDGFTKGLCCQGIVALLDSLEWPQEDLDSDDLCPLILSLRYFRAQYRHQDNPSEFIYDSLRLGQETAEKQAPSALEFLGQFRKAIELMKKNSGRQVPLAQCLGACIADYNRNTIHRKFKVDSWKRKIIHNLLKSPAEMVDLLAAHYDDHRHTSSGQAAPKLLKQASSEFASRCTLPYFLSTAVRNHLHYAAVFSPMSTCRHCHIHVFLSRSSSRLLRII
ncbi:Uncharacterized protein SCF082_LOCUS48222 [Durusdinium trenchii]|uniref:Uncharacterized protein n=1 Tax=Durusdinium trenchii TaxID=1381693 RepID=A0ABP0RRG1_9DINO